ncbi:uncharacterized protein BBA_10215 [Beauveria bassiana ARSEF 2860]|uniref:Uncharacterized protein n=1 Tax=Beauveria bassiana (strain ARSEF 2860) TaxID=655819 RepID=J4VQ62_BEAB2|nr:uncharacterized protein BBA_10215 [Beauveria bassiana ARSEF 2860]EJP60830.1 hypothetical protein BBA_10215 [Beauveria bassiana ARSEF 2860]
MFRPVYDNAPGLSTPQVEASFPKISRQTYQLNMQNVDDSSNSQQHAMTLRSHSIRPASSVVEHGDPGATAMSTNVQSSPVESALFNHGLVTPGQSPGFIGGEIVSNYMPPAPWDTNFALNSADTFQLQPQYVTFAVEGQQLWQPAPAPPPSIQLPSSQQSQPITSPFHDCIDSFGHKFHLKTFSRPSNGIVNGYIKFFWPLKEGKQSATTVEVASIDHEVIHLQPSLLHRHRAKVLSDCCSVDSFHHRPPPALSWQETTHPI